MTYLKTLIIVLSTMLSMSGCKELQPVLDQVKPLLQTTDSASSAFSSQQLAAAIRDPSFRIQVSSEGIHLFNRDGLTTHLDPFEFFPILGVDDDGGHAFYLGVELARAQIACQLGKRYVQDQPLRWGTALPPASQEMDRNNQAAGSTMKRGRKSP